MSEPLPPLSRLEDTITPPAGARRLWVDSKDELEFLMKVTFAVLLSTADGSRSPRTGTAIGFGFDPLTGKFFTLQLHGVNPGKAE